MKKLLFFCLTAILLLSVPLKSLHAEEITSYDAAISIQKNGTFTVSEKILYDFGLLQKHGIYRTIPYKKQNAERKQFLMDISNIQVVDEKDQSYQFTKSNDGSNVSLRIGNANKTLTGKHVYDILYSVSGGITYFSDHDELYWQVTGTEWTIPIDQVSVEVTLPESVNKENVQLTCFVGSVNSNQSDCTSSYENGRVNVTSQKALSPGEGLTVVVGFPKNIVAVLEPKSVDTWLSQLIATITSILFVLGALVWYLILPIYIIVHWFRRGRDPKPAMGVAKAWFDVPKSESRRPLTPGETGTLIDETADMREITATIVDLARRGYLKIIEKKKGDFTLEKRTEAKKGDTLEQFEKTLYDGIFSDGDSMRIKDADFILTVTQTKKELYEAVVRENFFVMNPETVRTKYTILGVLALFTFNLPLTLAAFIFGRAMPRKTITGAQCAAIAQSLKNFITSQDRQYKYQAEKQLFFEKFLPYAIVFGVEKIWAERFKDVGLKKPDWYDGYNMRTFNSIYLVNSLSSSMHSFSSAATPTSSSSGFSSGFSGGSVGGGGGGGGGGSW